MPATKPEIALGELTSMARRATSGSESREAHLRGRERLIAAVDQAAAPRRSSAWRYAFAAVAVLALALFVVVRRPAEALTFVVEGAAAGQSYLEAGPAGATARFSEGTTVALSAGARGRIVDVGARGARISLESGSARFDVAHREGAEWVVEAGPFTVTVTGTAFDLAWSGAELELSMRAGSVIVRGPPAPDGLALRAGQSLVADARRASVTVASAAPTSSAIAPSAPSATAAISATPSASARPREAAISWRARVAAGDFAAVIADAEAQGLDAVIDGSSLADLAALADAARYAGRADLARRALTAERTRFAGSAEARSAAFLLGRLSEPGSPATAVTWYDLYLSESPGGSLAAEALGRKMLAQKASQGRAAARPTAEEYQRRHPQGPFAPAAAEILGDP